MEIDPNKEYRDEDGNIIQKPALCACGSLHDTVLWKHLESKHLESKPNGKRPDECFSCWHWRENLSVDQQYPEVVVIVDGKHYRIGPEPKPNTPTYLLGHAGHKFNVEFLDGRKVVTHNLWCQGIIPEYWKPQFPNNAVFVKQ